MPSRNRYILQSKEPGPEHDAADEADTCDHHLGVEDTEHVNNFKAVKFVNELAHVCHCGHSRDV